MRTDVRGITTIITGVVVVLLIGWDIYAWFADFPGNTISEHFWEWGQHKGGGILPFLFGVLCGHLFFSRKISED